jgi:glycosyltransferase involved in cell wall biosynthesis
MTHSYTCVFRGSRDEYQVAAALAEAGRLDALVNDFYTPDALMRLVERYAPEPAVEYFARRHCDLLPSRLVRGSLRDALPLGTPWSRVEDVKRRMGRRAARLTSDGALVYNYHWEGFRQFDRHATGPRIVFQVHPVAEQIRWHLGLDRERSGIDAAMEPEEELSDAEVVDEHRAIRRADGVLCASTFVKEGLAKAGVPASSVHVSPYGAGAPGPKRRPTATAITTTEPRRPSDCLRLLWVGQLSYRKGPHWLLQALRSYSPDRVRLTLVSRAEVSSWLQPLPPHVDHVRGASDSEVQRLFSTHDLFVMPSLIEGFGLVYLEALEHGLPILATVNSGAPDIAEDDRNALFVEPGSADSIKDTIDRLLTEPWLAAHLREGAAASHLPRWADFRRGVLSGLEAIETGRFDRRSD